MQKLWKNAGLAALLCFGCVAGAMASEPTVAIPASEWEAMKAKISDLEARGNPTVTTSTAVDAAMESKVDTKMDNPYGPDIPVTTLKAPGKLKISLLLQVWYYNIERDSHGFFNDPAGNGIIDNNLANDINSFRIRRTETKLVYEFNECFGSQLMFDPTRETQGYPQFPSNLGNFKKSATGNGFITNPASGSVSAGANQVFTGGFSGGLTSPPRLMQDAYLTCKNVVPYVDFRVGQFKWKCGEEGVRDSANLDFVERSMLGFQGDNRDMGFEGHASLWGKDCKDQDGRFQLWAGVLDGAGSYYDPGNQQNRSDNNQSKDFTTAFLLRPLWDDCAGKLEFGASYYGGKHGPQSNDVTAYPAVTATTPIPPQIYASKGNVWFSYFFGNAFAKGLWVRGEYGFIRDRQLGSVIAFGDGNGAGGLSQTALQPFTSQGGYASIGYRFGEASWVNCMPCWLKDFELCGRYDQFQNIDTTNLGNPNRTSVFYTRVKTAGVNYYMGERTKIQVNYNVVQLPVGKSNSERTFHDTQNNSLLVNFQVAF